MKDLYHVYGKRRGESFYGVTHLAAVSAFSEDDAIQQTRRAFPGAKIDHIDVAYSIAPDPDMKAKANAALIAARGTPKRRPKGGWR